MTRKLLAKALRVTADAVYGISDEWYYHAGPVAACAAEVLRQGVLRIYFKLNSLACAAARVSNHLNDK